MIAHVLVTGVIFRKPEQRISKAGKAFVSATIKAKGDDAMAWWKVIVFSESAGSELMRLGDGDAVSVQGALKAEIYEKNGETKLSLTVFADAILALKQPPKQREKKEHVPLLGPRSPETAEPRQSGLSRNGCSGDDPFGDEIPF
jgi:single-stranded DNA-binding protein